jgi:hypothetical protein
VYEIVKPALPGLVGVAAYVHAHRDQRLSHCHDSDAKIYVKDQVRNLLHGASDPRAALASVVPDLLC